MSAIAEKCSTADRLLVTECTAADSPVDGQPPRVLVFSCFGRSRVGSDVTDCGTVAFSCFDYKIKQKSLTKTKESKRVKVFPLFLRTFFCV